MKKYLILLTALTILFAACGKEPAVTQPATETPATSQEPKTTQEPSAAEPVTNPSVQEPDCAEPTAATVETESPAASEAPSPGGSIAFDPESFFTRLAGEHPGAAGDVLAEAMLESPYFRMYAKSELFQDWFPGMNFKSLPKGITEASLITTAAWSNGNLFYIFTLEEGADGAALAESIKGQANPEWMYFEPYPDRIGTVQSGNRLFFYMYGGELLPVEGKIAEKARDFVEIFLSYRKDHPAASPLEIVEYMNGHQKFDSLNTRKVEEGRLAGFGDFEKPVEITGFADGAVLAPVMSPDTFIAYVFELPEGAAVSGFIKQLKDGANLYWQVCVGANTLITQEDGRMVLFIMCSE